MHARNACCGLYLAAADGAVVQAEGDDLGETGELDIVENDKGTVDGADGAVLCGTKEI